MFGSTMVSAVVVPTIPSIHVGCDYWVRDRCQHVRAAFGTSCIVGEGASELRSEAAGAETIVATD